MAKHFEKDRACEANAEQVDQSRRRLVKAAYIAPTITILGLSSSFHVAAGSTPPGNESAEPIENNLENTDECGQWLNPDCID